MGRLTLPPNPHQRFAVSKCLQAVPEPTVSGVHTHQKGMPPGSNHKCFLRELRLEVNYYYFSVYRVLVDSGNAPKSSVTNLNDND